MDGAPAPVRGESIRSDSFWPTKLILNAWVSLFCMRAHTYFFVFTRFLSIQLQVAKYEIMDGAPVRGESISIRLFLADKTYI